MHFENGTNKVFEQNIYIKLSFYPSIQSISVNRSISIIWDMFVSVNRALNEWSKNEWFLTSNKMKNYFRRTIFLLSLSTIQGK